MTRLDEIIFACYILIISLIMLSDFISQSDLYLLHFTNHSYVTFHRMYHMTHDSALNMEFTSSRTCAAGLWACEEMMHSPMASSELAYWLLRQLRHLQGSVGGGVPMDSVLRALKIAEREGHAHIMIREINTCK